MSNPQRTLFSLSAKNGGLGIPDPVVKASEQFEMSKKTSSLISDSIVNGTALDVDAHKTHVRSSKQTFQLENESQQSNTYKALLEQACSSERKRMERNFKTGNSCWLTAKVSERDNFVLSENEFHDRYGLPITNLPVKCDGCGEDFHDQHALICKKGGLITQRHNEIKDLLGDLSCLAWPYTQKEPLIREHSENQKALRADLLIRGVWSPQETASFDIRVRDTEAKSYSNRNPEDVLESCADEKRRKYSKACHEKHIAFTPLIFSVDGMMARESKIFLRRLADRLATKWDKPYSIIMNWVKLRLNFAILRASNLCIRGTRSKWRSFRYEDGAFIP